VRTNHLDATTAYFNGAALFRIPGIAQPIHHRAAAPEGSTLSERFQGLNTQALDFDTLVDSPFEMGCHRLHHFGDGQT